MARKNYEENESYRYPGKRMPRNHHLRSQSTDQADTFELALPNNQQNIVSMTPHNQSSVSCKEIMERQLGMRSFGLSSWGDMDSLFSSMRGAPSGSFHSTVMSMSSTLGPDGKWHVEKYAKTAAGNTQHKIREVKEAYQSSKTGIDMMAMERVLDGKGRRVVKERDNKTGQLTVNDELIGLERDQDTFEFDRNWNHVAKKHLPQSSLNNCMLRGNNVNLQLPSNSSHRRGILPNEGRKSTSNRN